MFSPNYNTVYCTMIFQCVFIDLRVNINISLIYEAQVPISTTLMYVYKVRITHI